MGAGKTGGGKAGVRPIAQAVMLALMAAMVGTAAQAAQPERWVKGRVIVQARAGLPEAALGRIVGVHGGRAKRIGQSNLYVVELPGNASEVAVAAQLAHNPHLKFAELDGLIKPELVSNDPYLGSQWHLGKIGAPSAWDTSAGSNVTIAVLDTGVDASHPDLVASVVPGWNFFSGNSSTVDVYGHGSKVAGSVAATLNNATGVAGVAGQARIMPIKISDDTGYGSWSAMAQGLTYAADNGVRVANISYMVGGVSTVQSAAQYMKGKGGLVFVSAGNTGVAATDAATTTLIPVGATNSADAIASFSTYGPYVALSAPGEGIYTTTKGGGYGAVSGTSFSSPIAAGVAALVMAANPALSSAQVESILFSTAQDLGAGGRDPYYGNGRVNAAAAIQAALSTQGADTVAPSVGIGNPLAGASVSGLITVDVNASDNVGVSRVELQVNGKVVASDSVAPYGFSWDSATVANGSASLVAVAYDAAGNKGSSAAVSVNVANAVVADTQPPVVAIINPVNGAKVTGTVQIKLSASDNAGAAGIRQTLYIDGKVVATASGASLSYAWNTKKVAAGVHQIQAVAQDASGNRSSSSIQVTR